MKAVLIPGDGIGREIAESVREVSAALNTGIEWQEFAAGAEYAAESGELIAPGTADCVLFNFGWLPGADHGVFSHAESSIPALEAALEALRPGGVLSAILYSGRVIGSDEKQELLRWMRSLPLQRCTVLVCDFANWAETAPLPCFLLKK